MKSNIKLLALIATFWFGLALSGNAQVIRLDSVLQVIAKENPMLHEYDSKVKALEEYTAGAKSWMAPMVGVGTFMTPYPGQTIEHEQEKGFVMFSFEQEIPNPAKLNVNKKYYYSKASVEEQGKYYQFNLLRAQAKELYFQWLIDEERLKVLAENKQIIELMLKLANIRYPYNQGSLGNIYKLEGRLQEIENMRVMVLADIESEKIGLLTLMNLPVETNMMVDTTMNVTFDHHNFVTDTASLSGRRSDVKRIDKTIEAMRLNQQLQQYQAKPDFKLRFDHMQPLGDMPSQFTVMAMVSIPIAPWSSRMFKSEVKGMQYDIEAMQNARLAILNESRGMLGAMAAKIKKMELHHENYRTKIIPALKRSYQTTMLAYEENREQLPMVIDGWEALNMAQMEYLDKVEELYTMIVSYEKQLEK